MYDVTSNELDKMILRQNKLPFVNTIMNNDNDNDINIARL